MVVYSKDALEDIEAAYLWLASKAPEAAIDLLRAIDRAEVHLARNPAIYRVVRRSARCEVRRVNIRPFRYQLYFRIDEMEVTVFACLHASRSPLVHARLISDRT
ncbi:MAG: type II toxin-antitoxin system RelE/ParE family toxin [Alphaproteobacteria bacterium]|nr:type II toxin-antitoxin system RelE/ParE family toxin [Alphaproteobacteria bacterium]